MPPGNNRHGGHGGHGGDHRDDLLDVTPEAVPGLRSAFATALARVDHELELADTGLRVEPWAKDPVSQDAGKGINALTVDHEQAAIEALRAYRRQLDTAVHTLETITEQYRLLEEDNQATVTQKGAAG
ncbi:transcriptional regulator [Actinokineospora sp. NBRC 105648]|uniref:transcriptional regulator n=1 Tax=Actinokineospora sp. NBRC 105648 TaxID=3032206 RepID=UPI0024A49621|nr:transcriptional regulator [Actinokineospora sp. NBRC 105648]GLZ38561.1 hypothetical protein Acsp05_21850 [Actinokineospora sp. NBRC 105648]